MSIFYLLFALKRHVGIIAAFPNSGLGQPHLFYVLFMKIRKLIKKMTHPIDMGPSLYNVNLTTAQLLIIFPH